MKLNRKNKMLLMGLAAGLYICYAFAFSRTIGYYREYEKLNAVASSLNDNTLLKKLVYKEKALDAFMEQYNVGTGSSYQNELLKALTQYSGQYGLRITDFREPHNYSDQGIQTLSYQFSLQGSFNGILLLINKLENNPAMGTVKHISFIKKRNYKTNTDYLTADVILQKAGSSDKNQPVE